MCFNIFVTLVFVAGSGCWLCCAWERCGASSKAIDIAERVCLFVEVQLLVKVAEIYDKKFFSW